MHSCFTLHAPLTGHITVQGESTYRSNYIGWPVNARPAAPARTPVLAPVDLDSFAADTFTTTKQLHHPPHDVKPCSGRSAIPPKHQLPWLAGDTTHQASYPWKNAPLLQLADTDVLGGSTPVATPFDAESEYAAAFVPHGAQPFLPHLTGIVDEEGLPLPGARRSLQVRKHAGYLP